MKTVRNMYNIRKRMGLSLAEVARRLGERNPESPKRPALHAFENAQSFAKQQTLEHLSEILDAPIEEIIRVVEVPAGSVAVLA